MAEFEVYAGYIYWIVFLCIILEEILHSSLLLEVWEQSLHTSLLEAKEIT